MVLEMLVRVISLCENVGVVPGNLTLESTSTTMYTSGTSRDGGGHSDSGGKVGLLVETVGTF